MTDTKSVLFFFYISLLLLHLYIHTPPRYLRHRRDPCFELHASFVFAISSSFVGSLRAFFISGSPPRSRCGIVAT